MSIHNFAVSFAFRVNILLDKYQRTLSVNAIHGYGASCRIIRDGIKAGIRNYRLIQVLLITIIIRNCKDVSIVKHGFAVEHVGNRFGILIVYASGVSIITVAGIKRGKGHAKKQTVLFGIGVSVRIVCIPLFFFRQ